MESTSAKARPKSGKATKVLTSKSKTSASGKKAQSVIHVQPGSDAIKQELDNVVISSSIKAKVSGRAKAPRKLGRKIESGVFKAAFLASPIQRVEIIRHGMPATGFVDTSKAMGVTKEYLYASLKVPRATVSKKIASNAPLSSETSERLLGLQKLIGQVQVMVEESGDPEGFNAAEWLARWMDTPVPALGGKLPSSFMDTIEGQELISRLLAQMQSGAYA